jgi:AcrR family transcriptional regulator
MTPTGVALLDAREQLFDAAERVLVRDGPSALTSRAVTTQAGCAKGVLHRHFADFDSFLAELVRDRLVRLQARWSALMDAAGSGTIAGNLAGFLLAVFEPVGIAMIGLVTSRRELLARLRATTPAGVPLLSEAAAMVTAYLTRERSCGRVSANADVAVLAPTLIGAGHLLFAGRDEPPRREEVEAVVRSVCGQDPASAASSASGGRRARPAGTS